MAQKDVTIPEISEGIEEADVSQVLVSRGDRVEKDQALLELESDKATVELPCPFEGTVKEILVSQGDTVQVGQSVIKVETGDEPATDETEQTEEKEGAEEGDTGDTVKRETDEDAESDQQGGGAMAEQEDTAAGEKAEAGTETEEAGGPPPASPSVRKLARHLDVDLNRIQGSGPGGRISEEDVREHAGGREETGADSEQQPEENDREQTPAQESAVETESREEESAMAGQSRKMSKIRRITAEKMTESWQTIPHVTQYDKTDISWFDTFRRQYGDRIEAAGGKLTVTSVILKVAARALREFPRFNATADIEQQVVNFNETCHIGVAVDTDRGLLVPVIKDCDRKTISGIAAELADKAARTRNGKITPEEMQGGNFTVSNLGGIGGTSFTPIIYPPQAAILGVSRASIEPVYEDGQFQPRKILPLSLSYDHRVIDGAAGARFLQWICEALAAPLLMELE